jgi:hypothetical protein
MQRKTVMEMLAGLVVFALVAWLLVYFFNRDLN